MRRTAHAGLLALMATLGLAACGQDDSVAGASDSPTGCLAGETIEFVVPYDPGGGYDSYARMLTPHLAKVLDAEIVVLNNPAAGGLGAVSDLANATKPDGRTLTIFNGGAAVGAQLAESAVARTYDLQDLTLLSRVADEPNVVVTSATGDYQTWEDVASADGIKFGSTGVTSSDYIIPQVLTEAFGLDSETILGFEGSSENQLAVIRGDVDAMAGAWTSRLPSIESGEMTPVLVMAEETLDVLPDTPTVLEQDLSAEAEEIVRADLARQDLSRVIAAPPDMPEELTTCLRTALDEALTDPAVIEEAEEANMPVNHLDGGEAEGMLETALDAPEPYVTLLREALGD